MPPPPCTIIALRNNTDERHGRTHEVFAPPGFRFDGGEHSKLAYGKREANAIAREDLSPVLLTVNVETSE